MMGLRGKGRSDLSWVYWNIVFKSRIQNRETTVVPCILELSALSPHSSKLVVQRSQLSAYRPLRVVCTMASCTNVCVIGAGHVGAPHAIVMASKCPKVKFTVVDDDARTIAAWNSGAATLHAPRSTLHAPRSTLHTTLHPLFYVLHPAPSTLDPPALHQACSRSSSRACRSCWTTCAARGRP